MFTQVARVLAPGSDFVFTDPMQADDCPAGVLQPILDRIHLTSLGSPTAYREMAACAGLTEESYETLAPHLVTHYSRVLQEVDMDLSTTFASLQPFTGIVGETYAKGSIRVGSSHYSGENRHRTIDMTSKIRARRLGSRCDAVASQLPVAQRAVFWPLLATLTAADATGRLRQWVVSGRLYALGVRRIERIALLDAEPSETFLVSRETVLPDGPSCHQPDGSRP